MSLHRISYLAEWPDGSLKPAVRYVSDGNHQSSWDCGGYDDDAEWDGEEWHEREEVAE